MAKLTMHVPDILRGYEGDLSHALATPLLQTWDKTEKYHTADQAEAIAEVILPPVHGHLLNAKIAYIFRESITTRDRIVWGKAGKGDAKLKFFAGYDFVIEFNWEAWLGLSAMQRIALVDHELEHCGRDEDENGATKWVLIPHDVEEFGSIVTRWGLWREDLIVFAGAVTHAQQLGLSLDGGRD